jgi:hypothetical protein
MNEPTLIITCVDRRFTLAQKRLVCSFLVIVHLAAFVGVSRAQTMPAEVTETYLKTLANHPRLLVNNAKFLALKTQNDPVSQQLKTIIFRQAESLLTADTIVYPTTGFKFGAMRTVQGRILTLALTYRLTNDRRFLNRARAELRQLAALPNWAPNHFLDVGEGALAAGVGLDWLYAELTPAERDQIAQAIVKNALLPSLDVPEQDNNKSWVNGDFNWNQVCHGGLVAGLLTGPSKICRLPGPSMRPMEPIQKGRVTGRMAPRFT